MIEICIRNHFEMKTISHKSMYMTVTTNISKQVLWRSVDKAVLYGEKKLNVNKQSMKLDNRKSRHLHSTNQCIGVLVMHGYLQDGICRRTVVATG